MAGENKICVAKFHGMGNDWIVASSRELPRSLPDFARAILDRHTGVGADGLIPVFPPRHRRHDARIRFFNADGSEAEMSGNGIRCAGAFLKWRGAKKRVFEIETMAGVKTLETVHGGKGLWTFQVGMGAPILDPRAIPFRGPGAEAPVRGFSLPTARGSLPATVTSLGNPHCTVFVEDFDTLDWTALGREIETSELFPNRTNVEFVKVISKDEIAVRFWERGVGHTMSSGTGSCGAVVASILNGVTGREVRVRTEAGDLFVAWPENGEVRLTGPAVLIAEGVYFYRPPLPRRGRSTLQGGMPGCPPRLVPGKPAASREMSHRSNRIQRTLSASPVMGTKRTGRRVSRWMPRRVRRSRTRSWSPRPRGRISRPPSRSWSTSGWGT